MRITSVKLTASVYEEMSIGIADLPLDNLHLHSLGQTVVLSGPNGGGKSRFLRLLKDLALKHMTLGSRQASEREAEMRRGNIEGFNATIARLGGATDSESERMRKDSLEAIAGNTAELERAERVLRASSVLEVTSPDVPVLVPLVPGIARLIDAANSTDSDVAQRTQRLSRLGSEESASNAPAYARSIMRAATVEEARKYRKNSSKREASDAEASRDQLVALLTKFLGAEVAIELDGTQNLTVEGIRESFTTVLSEGQQVLFQFACLLHAQGPSLKDCVVLLDEPENHLHPAALNRVIDVLRGLLPDGQLWIATHSVPLIAHLLDREPECLWFAESGRFTRAGRDPERILDSLMGGSRRRASPARLHTVASGIRGTSILSGVRYPAGDRLARYR